MSKKINSKLAQSLLVELERELTVRDGGYYDFFCEAWPVIEPATLIKEKYVRFLCEHMEALMKGKLDGNRLLINIPPGHSKSMICVVMSLPYLWTLDPTAQVIFAHKDQSLARDMARKTRMLIQSEWYQERWPVKILDDAKKVDRFSNDHGGGRVAVTVRQQITGAHASGKKFGGLIVIDDPDRPDDTINDAEDVTRWYREVIPTRYGNLGRSQMCIVQQRISQRDLSAYVLDSGEKFTHVCLPMQYDPERHCRTAIGEDWRSTPGDILSPLRTTLKDVERLKEHFGDPRIAEAQLSQKPIPEDGNIFKVEHFDGRYDALPRVVQYTVSCDLTFTGERTSDYAVLQVWARGLSDGKHYLVQQIRKKMGFVETARTILDVLRYYARANVLIEKSASGFAVLEILKEAGVERIFEFKTGRASKEARASTVSYLFDRGDIRFPRRAPWLEDYIHELTGFPAMRHDDQVDATTQYLAWITGEKPFDLYAAFMFADKMAHRISAQ
jgi:predicted phage terminase large subunit-like protein